MSSIDQRIVQMVFDNDGFESGISQTLKSLSTLKDGLNFQGQEKSVQDLQGVVNTFNLAAMKKGVTDLANHFTLKGQIMFKFIEDLADKVERFGVKAAKSLSVDQISAGWDKFESATRNVATIVNQSGKDIDVVEGFIDELNWYSDVTSYNTSAMSSALAKFVSNGIELEQAIPAIMGIGNSMTYAGASAQEAGRGFELYARAIGKNKMQMYEWKQLETMKATSAGLKEELIAAAEELGNLKKGEVNVGNFLDSLSHGSTNGWLTGTVLLKVLGEKYGTFTKDIYEFSKAHEKATGEVWTLNEAIEKYNGTIDEFGLKTLRSATLARTFKDAMDAAKDAASTAWMNIFSSIIGNAEEATEVWTELNDILVSIFAAPVQQVAFVFAKWKKIGGRNDLLEGLHNLREGIEAIAERIDEAFTKLFGAFNVQKLYGMSARFKTYTEMFKNFAKNSRFFTDEEENITKMGEALEKSLPHNVKNEWEDFLGSIEKYHKEVPHNAVFEFDTIEDSAPEKPLTRFQKALKGVVDIFYILNDFWDGFKNNLKELAPATGLIANKFLDWASYLGALVSKFREWENTNSIFSNFFKNIFKWINSLITEGGLLNRAFTFLSESLRTATGNVTEFFQSFKMDHIGLIEKAKDVLSNFKISLDDVWNVLTIIGSKIKSVALSIGNGILDIFKSINLGDTLSTVNTGLLTILLSKLAAMTKGFSFLGEQVRIFGDSLSDTMNLATPKRGGILGIIDGIKSFFGAGFNTLKLDIGNVFNPIIDFVKQITSMKIAGETIKSLAISIAILAASMLIMASIDTDQMVQAVVAITVCISMLNRSITTLTKNKGDARTIAAIAGVLIPFAAAIFILALATKLLGGIDLPGLAKGLIAMAISMSIAISFLESASEINKNVAKVAKAFIPLGIGLVLFATAAKILGNMPLENIITGVGGMVAGIAGLGAVLHVFPENTLSIAAGISLISLSLGGFIAAIFLLGSMNLKTLAIGLGAIVVGLGALATICGFMDDNVKGALSLTILAASLLILVPALMLLSTVNFLGMIGGLVGLVLVVGLLAAAAAGLLVIPGLIPAMIGFSAALALAGIGIVAIAAGLASLSGSLVVFVTSLVGIFPIAIELIWAFLKSIVVGFIDFLKEVGKALVDAWPVLLDLLGVLLVNSLEFIVKYGPALIDVVIGIIEMLLEALIIKIPDLIDTGLNLIVAFFDGLAQGIETKGPEIWRSLNNLFNSLVYLIMDILQGFLKDLPIVGDSIDAWFEARKEDLKTQFAPGEGEKIASGFVEGMEDGVDHRSRNYKNAYEDLNNGALTALNDSQSKYENVGLNQVNGWIKGLNNNSGSLFSTVRDIAQKALKTTNAQLGINSPSKKFMEVGKYSDLGFAKGLDIFSYAVTDSASSVGKDALLTIGGQMSELDKYLSDDSLNEFTITPVLDLSEIQNGASNINSMLSGANVPATFSMDAKRQQAYEMQLLGHRISGVEERLTSLIGIASSMASQNTAASIRDALNGTGVYVDRTKIGNLVSEQQANVRKARGM